MPDDHVPSTTSRQLGRELRALREGFGLPCELAAAKLGRDPMWLVQIECGQSQITLDDLAALLDLYAVADEPARAGLVALAHRSGGPEWLKPHTGWLSELERDFIILESEASVVRAFGILLIPELMRTEAYARAIAAGIRLPKVDGTVEQELDLLLHRQRHQVKGLRRLLHVILDESAICQLVGGKETMRGQIRHLIEQGERDDTIVQLIPREVGAHAGLDGSFHILDFPKPSEPSVSISHSALGPLLAFIELDGHFEKLEQTALPPAESIFMLEQALSEL